MVGTILRRRRGARERVSEVALRQWIKGEGRHSRGDELEELQIPNDRPREGSVRVSSGARPKLSVSRSEEEERRGLR